MRMEARGPTALPLLPLLLPLPLAAAAAPPPPLWV